MKVVAAIMVDLERGPLGTRSRLADDLAGRPVLRRTVERAVRCREIEAVHLLTPSVQAPRVRGLVEGLPVRVDTFPAVEPPYAALVRTGRIWGLDGWRGGIGGICAFDEDIHIPALAALARRDGFDAIVPIAAAAAVLDPALIDAIVAHHRDHGSQFRLTFVQAPPGLGTIVLDRAVVEELEPTGQPPGALLAYRPSQPTADLAGKEACYRPAAAVVEARGRLLCDTHRSFERVESLLHQCGEDADAATMGRWLTARETSHVGPVPEEIEIELTAVDPWERRSILRPGASQFERRGPIAMAAIEALIEAIADYDDVRIVLGGFGEPCAHPQFDEICRRLRASTAAAIAVRTSARLNDPRVEGTLFETPVDAVEVTIDAASPETYARVHGVDGYAAVRERIERWIERRMSTKAVRPLIVPSFIKATETLHELEAFFDTWVERLSMALVTGYSHRAGQLDRRAVTSMAPPQRGPCRRVFNRAIILADGRVTTCDQDFAGRQALGRIGERPFASIWRAELLERVRSNQIEGLPLCPACDEWDRP